MVGLIFIVAERIVPFRFRSRYGRIFSDGIELEAFSQSLGSDIRCLESWCLDDVVEVGLIQPKFIQQYKVTLRVALSEHPDRLYFYIAFNVFAGVCFKLNLSVLPCHA